MDRLNSQAHGTSGNGTAKQKVYFAGPLFSQAEKTFNQKLATRLENELGVAVFLPQRDGYEFAKLAEFSQEEKTAKIFALDRNEVVACDILVFVLDGRVPDEGAAFELGLAYAYSKLSARKLIVGLITDARASFIDQQLNPMLHGALDYIATAEDELLEYLGLYLKND